jgi:short-subunit dehydrogenase
MVTGAAKGIGRAFAKRLALEGFDLVLLDKADHGLRSVAAELESEHGVNATTYLTDLAEPGLEALARTWCGKHEIGLLVNNAGLSPLDPFLDIPLQTHLETLDVNCRATLILTHVVGEQMAARGRGGIVIVSSASALSGSPYFCNYAATKGYGLNLASGLWCELAGSGVDVLAVCPGMTDTEPVRERLATEALPFYVRMSAAEPVALSALRALGRQPVVVPTFRDRLSSNLLSRLAPRSWTLSAMKRAIEKMRR